ncbi:MAG: hypothetical protein KF729_15740 [Sandaracinaceae bacterium]|nr:hypothetical protein [Sandaracinaceae bacterium]
MHPAAHLLFALALQGSAAHGVSFDDHVGAAHLAVSTAPCLAGEDSKNERSEVPPALVGRARPPLATTGLIVHVEPAPEHRDAVFAHAPRGPPAR